MDSELKQSGEGGDATDPAGEQAVPYGATQLTTPMALLSSLPRTKTIALLSTNAVPELNAKPPPMYELLVSGPGLVAATCSARWRWCRQGGDTQSSRSRRCPL